MYKIKKIIGREIIDSRGIPTIESTVYLSNSSFGSASVPSGKSVGSKEAIELRDRDKKRFFGKGVLKAISKVNNEISSSLINKDATDQFNIDKIMIDLDGTKNKSILGSNSILSVSLATARAVSNARKIPLFQYISELNETPKEYIIPTPMFNIINGGRHANNQLSIQEFMIQPINTENFKKSIQIGSEIFFSLRKILKSKNMSISVGDEGGYSPNLESSEEALSLIKKAIEHSNYRLNEHVKLALDCAASELYNIDKKIYIFKKENKKFNYKELTDFYKKLIKKYSISSIEDGISESDWKGFKFLTKEIGSKIQLVGDDIFATNPNLLKKGIQKNIANSILIKLNQVGTLSETLRTIKIAKKNKYNTIISHRSGETEDTFISDLAVGTSSGQIKAGSITRSERVSKYNRLIRIEEYLKDKKTFIYDNNFNI